ncbi:MAG TPA: HAMP domain-containing methyl-accepting chemotaxis protein [Polyangiaceae bacterium]|nr:HAMP domain-containing methyl-accepting chemotaxis protein [Polyangiaceae bacterium]
MSFKKLTTRCVLAFLTLDALFNPLLMVAFLGLFHIDELHGVAFVLPLLVLAKIVANSTFLSIELAPYERFVGRGSRGGDEPLSAADRAVQSLPRRFGVFYAFSWSVTYALAYAAVYFLLPGAIGPRAVDAAAMLVVAVWFGGFAFGFPLSVMLSTEAASRLSVQARERGIALDRDPVALQTRIGVIALALGLGPTLWMMALGYMKEVHAGGEQRATLSALAAAELAQIAPGGNDAVKRFAADFRRAHASMGVLETTGAITDTNLVPLSPGTEREPFAFARDWLKSQLAEASSGVLTPRDRDVSVAFRRLDDSRVAVAVVRTPDGASQSFVLSAGVFALIVALWAPLCAVILGRAVSSPIERLTRAAREVVEEGKQSEMAALPVARNDEVGVLTDRFNDLLDLMRTLSSAAGAIAKGNLRVEIQGKGELPDAFRGMLGSLSGMVHQISETSVELGSAATEIFAASQEQEAAAASQSSAMEEISRTMDSLSESAAHVSDAVRGVLSNAERTLDNTDGMVRRITELSAHAGRIAEILEVIREIADKSDLLALNGSLEANRAGEQGHGFALVASEMRRLAERVTASVQDVKRLVSDIRESGSTTVMATEESKRLAQGTTEAARQITFVTQQQRSGTEQVSQSVKGITDVVTQTVAATAQTRTSAERLKAQADRLTDLVRRFETATEEAA